LAHGLGARRARHDGNGGARLPAAAESRTALASEKLCGGAMLMLIALALGEQFSAPSQWPRAAGSCAS
jgi:hypothetical protein